MPAQEAVTGHARGHLKVPREEGDKALGGSRLQSGVPQGSVGL